MNLVEYNPVHLSDIIIENKNKVLNTISDCIKHEKMNMLLLGNVPKQVVHLIITDYFNKTHNISPPKSAVLIVDCFSDLNLNATNNDIVIFSKSQYNFKKFVVVYNLEHIAENIQVYFKNIMNRNTFFIFCSDCLQKVYETILTRCVHIWFTPLKYDTYTELLQLLCSQESIVIEDVDEIVIKTNLNVDYMINLLNHMKLLKKTTIEKGCIDKYMKLIKDNELKQYFTLIKQNKLKEPFNILFDYYDLGFSLLDIYYFMYEYAKTKIDNPENYLIIELLCEYINNIYEGYDNKLFLAFLTNDINKIYHNIYEK